MRPLLLARWPRLPYAAGRLGHGSEVLGLDDAMSRDHDWGPRLSLFVPDELRGPVDAALEADLPTEFLGLPTRFTFTGSSRTRHRVDVDTSRGFVFDRLGFDPVDAPGPAPQRGGSIGRVAGRTGLPLRIVIQWPLKRGYRPAAG